MHTRNERRAGPGKGGAEREACVTQMDGEHGRTGGRTQVQQDVSWGGRLGLVVVRMGW